ncbi:MAG TPA: biotin transporter BioY [Acidimicrobiia bacterium]
MLAVAPNVLGARLASKSRLMTLVMVFGFAGLTAVAAQWRIALPFTPVPITGQTFAVLLAGAALGVRAGAASQMLYLLLGMVGLPVFAEGGSGLDTFAGATGGYLVGFVAAAAMVGKLAERHQDRAFPNALTAFLVGSFVIYAFGVSGLVFNAGMSVNEAILKGVAPFVFGDVLKAVAAGLLLPATWRLMGEGRRS